MRRGGPRECGVRHAAARDAESLRCMETAFSGDMRAARDAGLRLHGGERGLAAAILETVDALLVILDREGRIVSFNSVCQRATGFGEDEVLGKHIWDVLLLPEEVESVKRVFEHLCAGNFPLRHTNFWKTKDGGRRMIAWANSALLGADGGVSFVIGTGIDISERVVAEEALRRSEEQYRRTIDALPIGVVTVDRDLRILVVNEIIRRWCTELCSSVEPVGGTPMESFPFLQARVAEEYRHVLASGLPYVSEENHRFGERSVTMEVRKIPVFDHGRITRVVTLLEDITERKQIEEAMRGASRLEATATLAGGIAHDFNNLMTGVLGNAELLAESFAANPEAAAMLRKIAKAAERAGELAQLLVAYARGGKYQSQVIALNAIVAETLSLQERSFAPRVQIERRLDPELWRIEADPVQMHQVLMNLCINASEAIAGSGRVTVTTRNVTLGEEDIKRGAHLVPGRHVCLSVEDTGCGMDEETLAHVFEPFFSTKRRGRGLGLAAVYGIVKNHGGCLNVKSAPGKGTTFDVYFPATEAPLASAGAAAGLAAPHGTETVLIVDDEEAIVDIGRKTLEHLGYRALPATTAQRALEIARTFARTIHAAILDLGLPGLSGAELLPLLKAARPDMRVLICSGYEPEEAAQKLERYGADGFLQKPFRIENLGRALRQVLDK